MSDPISLTRLSFHDSTLVSISAEGSSVTLDFEDVGHFDPDHLEQEEKLMSISLVVRGVESITENGDVVHDVKVQGLYGDVIVVERWRDRVNIILHWVHPGPSSNVFCDLAVHGKNLSLTATPV